MPQSKNKKPEWILWPNGMAYKTVVFPLLIIFLLLALQAYLYSFPVQVLIVLFVFLAVPLGVFLMGHRISVFKLEVRGPAIGSFFKKLTIARQDAVFTSDQKIMGLPVFSIRDKRTNAEISAFCIYFSKKSRERLKELVVGK